MALFNNPYIELNIITWTWLTCTLADRLSSEVSNTSCKATFYNFGEEHRALRDCTTYVLENGKSIKKSVHYVRVLSVK